MRPITLIIVAACVLAVAGILLFRSTPIKLNCQPDISKVAVPSTHWQVFVRTDRCSAIDGVSQIYAVDDVAHKKVNVAFIGQATDFSVKPISPQEVEITLPNLANLHRYSDHFDGISVRYNFLPKDDPQARKQYKFWLAHPNDPNAVKWHKSYFGD